jgi:hypothetical protein
MAATIEELLSALTKAVQENTKAILGGKPAGTSNTGTPANSSGSIGKADTGKSKYTIDQVKAIAVKLRDEVSEDAAKATIKKHGGGNLAELANKKGVWDKFVADAEKQIADATTSEEVTDDTGSDDTDGL